jgi:hypothetical protein
MICPNIPNKLNKYIDQAKNNCSAIWNGKVGFEVDEKDKRYKVGIEASKCSCRYWQLGGIPCSHAITALFVSSKPLEDCIEDCYSVAVCITIYMIIASCPWMEWSSGRNLREMRRC